MNASGRAHNRHMASMSSPAVTKIPEKRKRRSILLRINSLASLPQLDLVQLRSIVNGVMTSARNAGNFVGFHGRQKIRIGVMDRAFFKRPRTQMAVQAFAVVVRVIKMYRLFDRA